MLARLQDPLQSRTRPLDEVTDRAQQLVAVEYSHVVGRFDLDMRSAWHPGNKAFMSADPVPNHR